MFANLTQTDVAFALAGLIQAVGCMLWLIGSWLVPEARHPTRQWAGFAGLSALSFVFLIAAMHARDTHAAEWLRADQALYRAKQGGRNQVVSVGAEQQAPIRA